MLSLLPIFASSFLLLFSLLLGTLKVHLNTFCYSYHTLLLLSREMHKTLTCSRLDFYPVLLMIDCVVQKIVHTNIDHRGHVQHFSPAFQAKC